jgi:hypothetical protein
MEKFVLQEIYVHPTGIFPVEGGSKATLRPAPFSNAWGRIRVLTPDASEHYNTYVAAAYPPQNWSLNELFFTAQPVVIGVVEFISSNGAQERASVVTVGIHRSKAWCEVLSTEKNSLLHDIFVEKAAALKSNDLCSTLPDMAVHFLDTDWCFSASIRKLPTHGEQLSYALYVQGCSLDQLDLWVRLHLHERSVASDSSRWDAKEVAITAQLARADEV